MRLSTGAIFRETLPETIITSACRGEARNVSAPNLERSFRDETVFIISIAQHASPNVAGHRLDLRAQLTTASSFTVKTSGNASTNLFSKPIQSDYNDLCRKLYLSSLSRHLFRLTASLGTGLQTPVERAFFPNVDVSNDQSSDE